MASIPDIVGRIKAVLPSRWFPPTAPDATTSATPVLDGVLSGLAWVWAWISSLISYTNLQTRLATATDVWLDLTALDFFGRRISRVTAESDTQFRARILTEVLRPRGTRAALSQAITQLTGATPKIFEPANTSDTGGYTLGGVGYGAAGGYGNLSLPFQCFVQAVHPGGGGVATVTPYGNPTLFNIGAGGYGVGAAEYAALSMALGQVTSLMIYQTISGVMPESTIAWVSIVGENRTAPLDGFVLDYNVLG